MNSTLHKKSATVHHGTDWLTAFRLYLVASGVLHLIWEIAQLPLYTIWRTGTAGEIAFAIVHCTAGDMMIATLVMVAALVVLGSDEWPAANWWPVVGAVGILGFGYTIYSEWINTVVRKSWAYTGAMPVLPWLGTGLSPLLQWLIIPALAFAIVARWNRRLGPRLP